VLTSLPPTLLPGPTALAVYRACGQIEVAMKRRKRLLDADLLRVRYGSPLADGWLHGQWLYALRLDKRLRRTMGDAGSCWDGARTATWWRPWKLLQDAVRPRLTGANAWLPRLWTICLQVLVERPRRRTLHRLPVEAMATCYVVANRCPLLQTQDIAA
jgi:hypothetical protein